MRKYIYALSTLLLLIGCSTDVPVSEETIITPSPTEYVFDSKGGTVTITVESNVLWLLRHPQYTDEDGVNTGMPAPEAEREMGGNGLRNNMLSLYRTNWFEIERIKPNVIVVKVEPNESGNERVIGFVLQYTIEEVGVLITQSAEE